MKKSYYLIFPILFCIGTLFYLSQADLSLDQVPAGLPPKLSSFASKISLLQKKALPAIKKIEEKVALPAPLRIDGGAEVEGALTRQGVILLTNAERTKSALSPLASNTLLNQVAEKKMKDMFERQYFEHDSPDGKGVSDLAREFGYDYILIGENLALGNFSDDSDLVTAWMNSPGHRANILKPGYTEIGVAVGEGMYEGEKVWIGVQSFGTPSSVCPDPSAKLKAEIESLGSSLEKKEIALNAKKKEVDAMDHSNPQYNQKVDEYNALVREYNALAAALKIKVADYNEQVRVSNDCRNKY